LLPSLLGGCSTLGLGSSTPSVDVNYYGSVTADDAQAVNVGKHILLDGGNAADAAAAMGMTLTVTLPSRAGLDGGGVCLVHQPDATIVDELDFLPPPIAGSKGQIPGLVRGLAELQVRFGVFRWQQAVSPAERIARDGIAVTAQLLADLKSVGLSADGPGGKPLQVGDVIPQKSVAATLSAIRTGGALEFYRGGLATRLVEAGVPAASLGDWVPVWRKALGGTIGDQAVYYPDSAAGRVTDAAIKALAGHPGESNAAPLFAAARSAGGAALASAAGPGVTLDQATATTSFAVSDSHGRAVSCAIGIGALFGTGHIIQGLDIYAAAPEDGAALVSLSPMLAVPSDGELRAAYAASGSTSAAADTAVDALLTFKGLRVDQALGQNRTPSEGPGTAVPDRVNGIDCADESPSHGDHCIAASDPRGSGYALKVDRIVR